MKKLFIGLCLLATMLQACGKKNEETKTSNSSLPTKVATDAQ
jgi:hypothetical protein